ncbi:glycerate kinase [Geomonas sp. RF6]|uniref:glycerate kinase type-2 family protein n=1 Tax=Geomonas sp. RF6 TaxID=2897342 RepID=UPI001E627C0F|nr:glycerate kinase [Geomonas sp. RF6]UFS72011.1 glycerate kinase [Geomonas sp. RF6]
MDGAPDREVLKRVFAAALAAVDPRCALGPHLNEVRKLYRGGSFDRLLVVGFGKGALPMAHAAEEALLDDIAAGAVIVPRGSAAGRLPERVRVLEGSHPHPDEHSVTASREVVQLLQGVDARTLLLVLVSGGGSALFTMPAPEITLEEKAVTSRLLMEASADIFQLNTVRKHLSAVKGGQLAALAHPARTVVLAVSDVPGDRPEIIASGPAYPDPSTFADAVDILDHFDLLEKVPPAVRDRLVRGAQGQVPETPKPEDPIFAAVQTTIVSTNRDAKDAAASEAARLGLKVRLMEEPVCGEARVAGERLAQLALGERSRLRQGERLCLVSGGETTVKVTGSGKGGRNQELALSFAMAVAGEPGVALLSAGTDGIDGPTDAAGAIVDGETVPRAREAGMEPELYLQNNDAYSFFDPLGALVRTGPTGTNVMDLQIAVISG